VKDEFIHWFSKQKFRHFHASEFTNYFETTRRGVRNAYPPMSLWPNIVPTLRIVDDLRTELGSPIIITSSYRSLMYNKRVGGAPFSQHREFRALDIVCSRHNPDEIFQHLLAKRRAGKFTGGLGRYATFVHIDTRGSNATWG
jgi:uncharacterized protein YcbK (DUF882 family)